MIDSFFDWLSMFDTLISIVAVIFSIKVWFKLRKQSKIIQEAAKQTPEIENYNGQFEYYEKLYILKPAALCISLVPTSSSIRSDVENFLIDEYPQRSFDYFEINKSGINQDQIEDLINEIRPKRHQLEAGYYTEVHLFIQGPVQAAALIGAILDNWKPVKLYQMNRTTRKYEFFAPLIK